MALWNNTTAPKWLLGLDADGNGLGNNGIKNVKTLDGSDIKVGDELAMADDLSKVGWRFWHSKENGQSVGQGRGWWEILATYDITGTQVDSAGPVVSSANISTMDVEVSNVGDDITINLLATDEDGHAVTYHEVSEDGCSGAIVGTVLTLSLTVTDVDDTATYVWKATANSVDSSNVTITVNVVADSP